MDPEQDKKLQEISESQKKLQEIFESQMAELVNKPFLVDKLPMDAPVKMPVTYVADPNVPQGVIYGAPPSYTHSWAWSTSGSDTNTLGEVANQAPAPVPAPPTAAPPAAYYNPGDIALKKKVSLKKAGPGDTPCGYSEHAPYVFRTSHNTVQCLACKTPFIKPMPSTERKGWRLQERKLVQVYGKEPVPKASTIEPILDDEGDF